jgi:hypothetical protein
MKIKYTKNYIFKEKDRFIRSNLAYQIEDTEDGFIYCFDDINLSPIYLSEVAHFIILNCNINNTYRDIINLIINEYEINENTTESDLINTLGDLVKYGLISIV